MRRGIPRIVRMLACDYFQSWHDVEDARQEGLLVVLQIQAREPGVTVKRLTAAVRNRFLDILRHKKRTQKASERWAEGQRNRKRDHELAGVHYERLARAIARVLPVKLSRLYLEMVLPSESVHDKHGNVTQELIGQKLGLSLDRVKKRVRELKDVIEEVVRV